MKTLRISLTVAAVAAAGIAGSLLVGRIEGMNGRDLATLVVAMLPSLVATVLAVAVARPLLKKAPIAVRMVTIAMLAAAISLVNLVVASHLMFVSNHDVTVLAVLVASSVAAGAGAALGLARSSKAGIERLVRNARRLGGGELDVRIGPLDAEPEIRTLAATLDDMADRLVRSIEHERAVESMRRNLFTAVSHDLRTPMNRLKLISDALNEGIIEDPGEVRRYAGEMRAAVDSLVKLVDDLFELVQADNDELASTGRARLGSILDSVVQSCSMQAREKGIAIRTNLDGAGDASCSPRLERVLQNLVVNAVRHTDHGEVLVSASVEDSELRISVTDTGEGIDERHLHMVFEPFWRGDSSRSSPGTGLGLTLARRLVEHLGGGIDVVSGPGEGARFTVWVPTTDPPSASFTRDTTGAGSAST